MTYIKNFLFIGAIFLPVLAFGQFTGFNDSTVSTTYWSTESGYVSGAADVPLTQQDTGSTDKNFIGTDKSVNTNAGNGQCTVNDYLKNGNRTLGSYVDYIGCMVRVSILPFMLAIAVLSFVWGVVQMIMNPANEEAQTKGRTFILWGIIGLFVITAMYSLVAVIRRTVGFGYTATNDPTPYTQLKDKIMNVK